MRSSNQNSWAEYSDFILIEMITVIISFVISFLIRLTPEDIPSIKSEYMLLLGVITLFNVLASCLFDAFKDVFTRSVFLEFAFSLRQVIIVFAAVTLYLFTVQESATYSRIILYLTFLFDLIIGFFARLFYKKSKIAKHKHVRRLLIITNRDMAKDVLIGLKDDSDFRGMPAGIATVDSDCIGSTIEDIAVVAHTEDDIIEYVRTQWVDEVLLVLPGESSCKTILINSLIKMGITIHVSIEKIEGVPESRQNVETIGKISVITSSISNASAGKLLIKRLFDIFFGLIGCIITILVAIVIAPFILIKSPGHLIFVQKRVGKNGKYFKMLKFRSMVNNAEAEKKKLMDRNIVQDNLMFKLDFDPRVIGNKVLPDGTKKTGIGEFIRRTSIDELPQFFNVLKGDMSLVGTRPPTVDEYKKYSLHHRARLSVKPGITGMWQVSGRSDITDFEEVVKLDTEYIYNWSLSLDAKIIGKTVGVVLKRKGAK